jgi:transposase
MKRDGRTLDHKTLEEIRMMAVQRVLEGERPSVVIASYGFARPVIYRWLRDARGKGRGLRALRSRKGTGRPRRLAPKQEQQLFRWINGKDPRQHGFDFGLWTRLVVRKLIADKFGANLGVTAVGKLLAKLGLTPQKPLKRAYERDPAAIEAWKRDTYPSIAGRAKRRGAEIYFWDESGFRADVVQGTTWGVRGQTPVIRVPGQRQSVSAASAVNARGGFSFAPTGRDELWIVYRDAQDPDASSQEALDLDPRQFACPQRESGKGLCRIDKWKTRAAFLAGLCA